METELYALRRTVIFEKKPTKDSLKKRLKNEIEYLVDEGKLSVNEKLYEYLDSLSRLDIGTPVNVAYYNGRGKHTRCYDFTNQVIRFLEFRGINCVTGNNAPRGGKIGNYVKLT